MRTHTPAPATERCLVDVAQDGADAARRFTLRAEGLLEVIGGRLAPLEPFFERFAWEG